MLDQRSQGSEALVEHELMLHGINWYTDFHQFLQRNLDRPTRTADTDWQSGANGNTGSVNLQNAGRAGSVFLPFYR